MPAPSEEVLYAKMQRGLAAAGELQIIAPILAERRETLIRDALSAHNSMKPESKLTDRSAALFVAALAETYRLQEDIETAIRDGQKAGQHFTK